MTRILAILVVQLVCVGLSPVVITIRPGSEDPESTSTDSTESNFRTTIPFPTVLQSNWQLVANTTNQDVAVRGSGYPPYPSWTIGSDGGIKSPIPGTPFYDVSITYYWRLT